MDLGTARLNEVSCKETEYELFLNEVKATLHVCLILFWAPLPNSLIMSYTVHIYK